MRLRTSRSARLRDSWPNESASAAEREFLARYLGQEPTAETIAWQLTRLAFGSVAGTAIVPLAHTHL